MIRFHCRMEPGLPASSMPECRNIEGVRGARSRTSAMVTTSLAFADGVSPARPPPRGGSLRDPTIGPGCRASFASIGPGGVVRSP